MTVPVVPVSQAEYSAWSDGGRPASQLVRPGLWTLPVAFPDNPLRYTMSYVLEVPDGVVVIDPGYGSDENWELLRRGLQTIGFEPAQVRAVVVTHYHLDHWGLADRLAEAAECEVVLAGAEVEWFGDRSAHDFSPTAMRAWYASLGAPDELLETIASTDDVQQTLMHDASIRPLRAGDDVPFTRGALRAVATPGHTDGHLSFAHRELGVLLGGDHVLPSVSTNVSLTPFGDANPLGAFLGSFDGLREFAEYEILPAHQYRYTGLGGRLAAMRDTVERRLAFVRDARRADPRASAWEIAARIPRKRRPWAEFDALSLRLGLGEAAAYLAHLGELDG